MRDGLLELIVKFSEDQNDPIEIPVTLIVSGFLVSGHVISRERYIAADPYTAKIKEIADADLEQPASPDPEDDGARKYIHLRDAKYFTPGQPPIPGNGAISCRIKLSDVSGFNFGYLGASPEG